MIAALAHSVFTIFIKVCNPNTASFGATPENALTWGGSNLRLAVDLQAKILTSGPKRSWKQKLLGSSSNQVGSSVSESMRRPASAAEHRTGFRNAFIFEKDAVPDDVIS